MRLDHRSTVPSGEVDNLEGMLNSGLWEMIANREDAGTPYARTIQSRWI